MPEFEVPEDESPPTAVATLKSYFETGDKPTQAQFHALIDSVHPDVVTLGEFAAYIRDNPVIVEALADLVAAISVLGLSRNEEDLLLITDIPTTNPSVAGAIWNDGGTLKVSAG
jgi:hypothetical protein